MMNLSLQLLLASIVGPCLLAFTLGYFSRPFMSDYHHYLLLAINEAFKTFSSPFGLSDSSSSSSNNVESSHQMIQWNRWSKESVISHPTELLSNQNVLTESAQGGASRIQQVFIELQNIDGAFLDSEKMVDTGFLTLVKRLKVDAFTYECHRALSGKGLRCNGYSGQGIISLYTWPSSGILSLTIRSGLHDPWTSILPLANEIFAVPMAFTESNFQEPCLIWSLKRKCTDNLSWMIYKPAGQLRSSTSDTNSVDSYEISSSNEGVHMKPVATSHQSEVKSDAQQENFDIVYSEALVHPIMFAHDDPKRVVIFGNGTGATLREVLKHKTVEKVVLVGSDPNVHQMNTKVYPQRSDCSNINGSTHSCYDDPRVETIVLHTLEWFRCKQGDDSDVSPDARFDVIILEKSDTSLSSTTDLEKTLVSLSGMLSADGALVVPHGVLEFSIEQSVLETLVAVGFEAIHRYEEFLQLNHLSFIACFRNQNSRALWFANAAELHVKMQSRLIGNTSQSVPSVHWFDEATMMNYHFPSRFVEDSFCSQPETPYMCDEGHGFDPEIPNAPISSFAVGVSRIPGAGRGVFFQVDVAKDTYIAADESVYDMIIYPTTTSLFSEMIDFLEPSEFLQYSRLFYTYIYGYGFAFEYFGKPGYLVDKGILTFINHGCNGTGVMGEGEPIIATEMTVDLERMPPELENYGTETHIYNPFIDRNSMKVITAGDRTLVDIKAGAELLDNYLRYLHEGNWKEGVLDYRAQCLAIGKGVVTGYEERKSSSTSTDDDFHSHDHKL